MNMTACAGVFVTTLVSFWATVSLGNDTTTVTNLADDYSTSTQYLCDDKTILSVQYLAKGEDEFALLSQNVSEPQRLNITVSGSGTRYESENITWHVKANQGVLTTNGQSTNCTEKSNSDLENEATTPRMSQTVQLHSPVFANEQGLFWFTGDGYGRGSPKTLRFAIPETDAQVIFASCEKLELNAVRVEGYGLPMSLTNDQKIKVMIKLKDNTLEFQGTAFIENDEYQGIRFSTGSDLSLWGEMAQSNEVEMTVNGAKWMTLNTHKGRSAITEFISACSH